MTEKSEMSSYLGKTTECRCPECQRFTTHKIISVTKKRISQIRCEICGTTHKFSKKKCARRDTPRRPRGRKKRAVEEGEVDSRQQWEAEIEGKGELEPVEYRMGGKYTEETIISHPKFGVGIVKRVLTERKIEVLFEGGRKTLVQNIKK